MGKDKTSDGWTTVVSIEAKRSEKATKRRENRGAYVKFCREIWPRMRDSYVARARELYMTHQRQTARETPDMYARRVEAAVQKARLKGGDCGRTLDQCEASCRTRETCEDNRRAAFAHYQMAKREDDELKMLREAPIVEDPPPPVVDDEKVVDACEDPGPSISECESGLSPEE